MVFHRQSETEIDSRPPYNFTLKLDIEPKEAPVANGQMSYRITNTINIYHITSKYLPPTKMSGIGILRMPQLLHKMEEIGSHQLDQVNEDTVQNQHSSTQFQTRNRGK